MNEKELKPGTIVYHKSNNLRMTVISIQGDEITCRFVNVAGNFDSKKFHEFEVSTYPEVNQQEKYARIIQSLQAVSYMDKS